MSSEGIPPEHVDVLKAWLAELEEVTSGSGRHFGHKLEQVGRCVCCSCGYRYQGSIPQARRQER